MGVIVKLRQRLKQGPACLSESPRHLIDNSPGGPQDSAGGHSHGHGLCRDRTEQNELREKVRGADQGGDQVPASTVLSWWSPQDTLNSCEVRSPGSHREPVPSSHWGPITWAPLSGTCEIPDSRRRAYA